MYNPETIKDIQSTLEEYKDAIDSERITPLALSDYLVTKPWGSEQWLDLTEFYAFKVIKMKKGCQSSLQSHDYKVEANYVIEGIAEVLLEDENGELQSYVFNAGSGWTVPVGKKHRVIAITDYTALEVSSPNLNDVIRYNDEFGRGNGKIDGEHEAR